MKKSQSLSNKKFSALSSAPLLLLSLTMMVYPLPASAQTAAEFAEIWDKEHVSNKLPSNVRHKDLLKDLEDLKKLELKVDEVGKSAQGREIFQIQWGKGPMRVFLWSQMHGDEPTATSALTRARWWRSRC